jgi:uncharacterized protein
MNDDDSSALDDFCGTVRLFPLPNVVLFPLVVQPLHIFEPRYRQMTADALADDRLIAPALLRPGWEGEYPGRPAVYPVVCVGKIVAEQRLPDGRFNLLLHGLRRARILREVEADKLYRIAQVELLADGPTPIGETTRELRRELSQAIQPWFPAQGPGATYLRKVLNGDHALGELCDLLAFAVPLPFEIKQQLLEELHPEPRARTFVRFLTTLSPPSTAASEDRTFPPGFSAN